MVDGKTMAEQFLKEYPNKEEKPKKETKYKITKKDKLSKLLKQKIVYKPKGSKQMIVNIKESKPAEYVNRYFKNEWEETKKSLFFS